MSADQQINAFNRNFSLLSFGEEAEEDESTVASVSKVGLLLKYMFSSPMFRKNYYVISQQILLPDDR